jgi:hypothetical protein
MLIGQTGATACVPLHEPVKFEPPPPLAPPTTKDLNGLPLVVSKPSGVPGWSELAYAHELLWDALIVDAGLKEQRFRRF